MDVRDQSKAIDQARDRYREAQEDLRSSYDKNLNQMKETFDTRTAKQSKNYDEHKTKLEEENRVNSELFNEKTKNAISRSQEEFKNKLRDNTAKFEKERNESKANLNDKLSTISDSYKKSFEENNRYHDQVKKSLSDRYESANKRYQDDFNKQVTDLDQKSTRINEENRAKDREERMALQTKNTDSLDNLRAEASEQKFKEVSRLKEDNENLRTTLTRDNKNLKERQEERVADLFKLKDQESSASQKNFENLQKDLRQRNVQAQEKQNIAHKLEAKSLEKKFNDDVRNIQRVADQKVRGGTQADNLQDELQQSKKSYENRLQSAHDEIARVNKFNSEKEDKIDTEYREKLRQMKTDNIETLSKQETESNDVMKKTLYANREKNSAIVERYKTEANNTRKDNDDRLGQLTAQSKERLKDQRVEFGRVVNTMNDKNMETINSLKEDFSKDKTASIEKSKKDFNDEKVNLKNEFNRQSSIRDTLYEQKLADIEKQTNKIIDNYENRMAQIVRKAENEVASVKAVEAERSAKESQANKVAIENLRNQNNAELSQMRDKYEMKIARDRAMTENQTNRIVQKYEDLVTRERNEHQKELSSRLGESQAQFERLFKSSELEKESMRNQYEQRIENMRLQSLAQENSKKA